MRLLNPYVLDGENQRVYLTLGEASPEDIHETEKEWQSYWGTGYLEDPRFLRYAAKTSENELVGLAAYEVSEQYVAVYMPYIEAAPHSNPTIVGKSGKRYHGIAKMFLAFAVKLSAEAGLQGDVVFEAKTPELAAYYKNELGALALPSWGGPERFLISDEVARELLYEFI